LQNPIAEVPSRLRAAFAFFIDDEQPVMPARRILNPHAVPVVGNDAHLPALATAQLQAERLRQRFLRPPADWQPEFAGDGRIGLARAASAAAVLVPLVQRADGLHVLLTRRTDHLRDHAGQISFPGGRSEPFDTGPVDTAMREATEEVGLQPMHVEILGQLPTYTTVTHFVVTPVVALVTPPFDLHLDPHEVAEAFEVPLSHLMSPAQHQRHVLDVEGHERQFLSMPWRVVAADGSLREYFIWGATAAMLRNLYGFIAAA
jgi:8-oxo-dGTP pyrophosphatase MutT (NUDIX family)